MNTAATFEAQATACLESAERHRDMLLAVACKLAGNKEGGMDLFQQTSLNCHDAIQRWGFPRGDRYEFYLLAALKNLHYKETKKPQRFVEFTADLADAAEHEAAPATDGYAHLASQVMNEVRERFDPADRLALRLHVDGHSCRDIADLTGRHGHQWIAKRLAKMKDVLRETFSQAFEALSE